MRIQDNSRSSISVPIESHYATSYQWLITSHLIPFARYCTVTIRLLLLTGSATP